MFECKSIPSESIQMELFANVIMFFENNRHDGMGNAYLLVVRQFFCPFSFHPLCIIGCVLEAERKSTFDNEGHLDPSRVPF